MQCYICDRRTYSLFVGRVLNKHVVKYYKCSSCEFIQTEEPFWLDEAYNSAISNLDVGLVARNLHFAKIIPTILEAGFDSTKPMLDYGGGYGLFVRLMRDKGFNFFRQDSYCENIFAKHFDIGDYQGKCNFEVLTAFEVFEHLYKPLDYITEMFSISKSVIFSTHLQPHQNIKVIDDWGYFSPETGQHIAFYSKKTLEVTAEVFGKKLYTNNRNLHLICDGDFEQSLLDVKFSKRAPNSLMQNDVEFYKSRLSS